MRISKYVKLDVNILMEYIYDDSNLISEPYEILVNTKDNIKSFISTSTSGSLNTLTNQLFQIDPITRTYGKSGFVDSSGNANTNYSFLQVNNYASGFPIRYDTIKMRFPINYTFGENIGFYIRVYSFDYKNTSTYDLCNFYFDITDVNTKNLLSYTNPPILFQETLWGKEIDILIPSLYELSNQRKNNMTVQNTINYNLTNGIGLSTQSPIFFEFSFISGKQVINSVVNYILSPKISSNLTQIPEYQQLGVVIQHSTNGDFFEIYGVYNNTIAEFNTFINNSVYLGNRYYVNYIITVYEQNIRINSLTITVTENFNSPIEYRPIIKYSSTTAVIDVEMNLIDAVDNSTIIRKASYGMLQDEVSKYSLNLTKINLANATKPKIYNNKSVSNSQTIQIAPINNIETVNVPYAVLSTNSNIVAKSDNIIAGSDVYYGDGKIIILIKPFDNIFKFTIAKEIVAENGAITPNYMDLSSLGQIQLVFKNSQNTLIFDIFSNSSDVNLSNGVLVFLVQTKKVNDIRSIYNSGVNVFYITATQQGVTTVIYSGLFEMYDSTTNINSLKTAANAQISNSSPAASPVITVPADNTNTSTSGKVITTIAAPNLSLNVAQTDIASNLTNLINSNNSIVSTGTINAIADSGNGILIPANSTQFSSILSNFRNNGSNNVLFIPG